MDRHVDAFLEMLAAERGAARNTLLAYAADLNDFTGFAAARGTGPAEAGEALLRDWLVAQSTAGFSARTAARRLSAIRQFHRFLLREGIAPTTPPSCSIRRSWLRRCRNTSPRRRWMPCWPLPPASSRPRPGWPPRRSDPLRHRVARLRTPGPAARRPFRPTGRCC